MSLTTAFRFCWWQTRTGHLASAMALVGLAHAAPTSATDLRPVIEA